MKKISLLIALFCLGAILIRVFWNRLDVVGNGSVTSFAQVLTASSQTVAPEGESWTLTAPDGSARFIWSGDFSKSTADVRLEASAEPFLKAGLDVSKLPAGMCDAGILRVEAELGSGKPAGATPLAAYEQLVGFGRDRIKYHQALDHYGVDLGGGFVFEWAKDLRRNDKDIVFAFNPEPFLKAGVEPGKVEGWAFAKVTIMSGGKKIAVDRFLKPFDLK